jgi:hypothetical protein
MWEPRRLTTIWASTACYRDSFTFTFTFLLILHWSPSPVRTPSTSCLVRQPYGKRVLCKHFLLSSQRMNTGSVLKIESSSYTDDVTVCAINRWWDVSVWVYRPILRLANYTLTQFTIAFLWIISTTTDSDWFKIIRCHLKLSIAASVVKV